MGLKGSLRDFGLSEILQLIGLQRRSGRLEIVSDQGKYQILIAAGKIVRVEKKPEAKSESLSDYLAYAGAVPASQGQMAEQKAKSELKPLEAVLVGLGFISPLDLKSYVFIRNLDLIYQLFLVKDGEYEFEAEPVNYHPDYVVEIDTEQVLMDGYRIKDEWKTIMTEIGSLEAVFRKRAGEFGVADKLERQEARVYELIDGKSGIPEIAALAQITRFDACKALAELKRKGRVEAVSQVDSKAETRESRSRVIAQNGFWVLILVLAVLLANGVRIYLYSGTAAGSKSAYAQSWQEERIRQALEIYRLEKGSYPGQLSDLAGQGLLGDWDLKFAQNSKYYYQEGGYNLTGPKP